MPDDALPIEIDGHTYLFRLTDNDVREIERKTSLFVAFHPSNMTYENAARWLQHGLQKKKENEFVHIFPQDETGLEPAFQYVKKYCCAPGFAGVDGIVFLYAYFNKALIALQWRADPDKKKDQEPAEQTETPKTEDEPPKN